MRVNEGRGQRGRAAPTCCCPSLPISYSLHHPSLLWLSVVVVVICCYCHVVSLSSACLHHCRLAIHRCGCLLSLWSSIVAATLCHHCLPVSIIGVWLLLCVVINAKGGRGWGGTWQWLGVLWWLFVVAVMVGVCEWLMTVVGSGSCRWWWWWWWWWWECLCLYLVRSSIWLQVGLVMISGKDWLRLVKLVFCWSWNFWSCERLKTGLWLWSLMVLGISSLGQSQSSPVSVFFQSWDWTSKH